MMLFVGMFGGLIAFGIVGLFLGPIILYLLRELDDGGERGGVRRWPRVLYVSITTLTILYLARYDIYRASA
jgi:hypothetical protein